jgi:hypothetical protein
VQFTENSVAILQLKPLSLVFPIRYNTGISKMSIPVLAGIEVFSRNIPLPLKKKWEI